MLRTTLRMTAVVAACAVCSLATAEQIRLIHSFEQDDIDVPRPTQLEVGANVDIGVVTGVGNTDGNNSLAFTPNPTSTTTVGDNGRLVVAVSISAEDVNALRATRTIKWDITSGADPDPNDDSFGFGTWFSYNSTLTGFVSSTTFPSTFDTFFVEFVDYGAGALGPTVTSTVTLDPVVIDALEASIDGSVTGTPGFAQLYFGHIFLGDTESTVYTQPTIYFDNLRIVVPEPGSLGLALLGLAVAAAPRAMRR